MRVIGPGLLLAIVMMLFLSPGFAITLYYVESGSNVYSVDSFTGADTLLFTIPGVDLYGSAQGAVIDSFYAADIAAQQLVLVNPIILSSLVVGPFGADIRELAYDVNGDILYGTNYSSLYTIDFTTGAASLVGSFGGPTAMWAMGYDPTTDTLYGVDATTDQLYSINSSTGVASEIGATGISRAADLYVLPIGYPFGVGNGADQFLYTVDLTTGAFTPVGPGLTGWAMGLSAVGGDVPVTLESYTVE